MTSENQGNPFNRIPGLGRLLGVEDGEEQARAPLSKGLGPGESCSGAVISPRPSIFMRPGLGLLSALVASLGSSPSAPGIYLERMENERE